VESQVRKVFSDICEKATGSALVFHTCRGWFDEWLTGKNGTTAERTMMKYKQVADDFLSHLGDRAELPLPAISQKDVRSFRDALTKSGLSPSTVNMTVRKVLSVPFLAALRNGFITVNPCGGVNALTDDVDAERDVFTREDVLALHGAAQGDWKGVILAGYFTGLRLRDITELLWESIDMESGVLNVKTRKTGKWTLVPLAPELLTWLRSQPRGIAKAPVFPSLAGKSGAGKSGLSKQFAKIMARAGIKGRTLRTRKEGSAGRTASSLSFHSLRHTFNSALQTAGVSQETRMKFTGHTTAAMNSKYTHHEVETLRDAVAKMPAIMGAAK